MAPNDPQDAGTSHAASGASSPPLIASSSASSEMASGSASGGGLTTSTTAGGPSGMAASPMSYAHIIQKFTNEDNLKIDTFLKAFESVRKCC